MTLYWPFDAGAARLAVADLGAGEVLELQRDVLRDVAHPRAVLEAGDEAAPAVQRAGVVLEGGHPGDEAVDEPGILVVGNCSSTPRSTSILTTGCARPVVRPAQHPRIEDVEGREGTAGPRSRAVALGAAPVRGGSLGGGGVRARCLGASRLRGCRLRGRWLGLHDHLLVGRRLARGGVDGLARALRPRGGHLRQSSSPLPAPSGARPAYPIVGQGTKRSTWSVSVMAWS